MELKGRTIKEALELIKSKEKDFFDLVILSKHKKVKNMKSIYKKYVLYNNKGKRIYRVIKYTLTKTAKNIEPEQNKIIIKTKVLKQYHDNFSLSGYINTEQHNVYYLYIADIEQSNIRYEKIDNQTEELIEYKDGELTAKQKRFTL